MLPEDEIHNHFMKNTVEGINRRLKTKEKRKKYH